jgi:hypothetical protein
LQSDFIVDLYAFCLLQSSSKIMVEALSELASMKIWISFWGAWELFNAAF